MNSILITIKKMLGIDSADTAFDTDVIVGINSALMILSQLGVGPSTGFRITGSAELWTDFLGQNVDLEAVKTYVYMKVKLVFDPPSSSAVIEALNRAIIELEWRLSSQVELRESDD